MTARRPTRDQPTAAPTRKATAGGLGTATAGFVAWLLRVTVGVEMEPEAAVALGTILGFLAAYYIRDRAA